MKLMVLVRLLEWFILLTIVSSQNLIKCEWCRFLEWYPNHYLVYPLSSSSSNLNLNNNDSIIIDGYLNDTGWMNVEYTNTSFEDIAISLYNSSINGYCIPKNHSTQVKVRYDQQYLYIGAILYEPWIYGNSTGHNANNNVPYKDHDFEVFIDFSGSNYYYKEFEINVLNATYDVLWHKTKPIPCNDSCNNNYNGDQNNRNDWCQHTSYPGNGVNGNWTMYGPYYGLNTATQFQWLTNESYPLCTYPCAGCPRDTPNSWTPWSTIDVNDTMSSSASLSSSISEPTCNGWPEAMYEYWTVEIAMPLFKNEWHGGILDSGNDTLDIIFNATYNPNNINHSMPLYWFVDFARTEHPMNFINDHKYLQPIENQTMLAQIQSVYPTLLGIYSYNNYWEWVWQPVGITQYMHYPEYWGILEFASSFSGNTNNNNNNIKESIECWNIEWPGRYIIYSLWWSNYQYFLLNNGSYTLNVDTLVDEKYCIYGYCNYNALKQAIFNETTAFHAEITLDHTTGCINILPQYQNNLTIQLYGGPCYHISLQVFVDDFSSYTVSITESHHVTVDKSFDMPFCFNNL